MYLSGILPESCQSQKEKVIIRHKLPELIKSLLDGEPRSCAATFQAGGCTCPMYYRGVVSLEKGRVIIRHKLPELVKSFCGGDSAFL